MLCNFIHRIFCVSGWRRPPRSDTLLTPRFRGNGARRAAPDIGSNCFQVLLGGFPPVLAFPLLSANLWPQFDYCTKSLAPASLQIVICLHCKRARSLQSGSHLARRVEMQQRSLGYYYLDWVAVLVFQGYGRK